MYIYSLHVPVQQLKECEVLKRDSWIKKNILETDSSSTTSMFESSSTTTSQLRHHTEVIKVLTIQMLPELKVSNSLQFVVWYLNLNKLIYCIHTLYIILFIRCNNTPASFNYNSVARRKHRT